MSSLADSAAAQIEAQIEAVTRTIADAPMLTASQGDRIAEKLDRLQSQLMEVTPAPPMSDVYARLGGRPATDEEFAALLPFMGPPDDDQG